MGVRRSGAIEAVDPRRSGSTSSSAGRSGSAGCGQAADDAVREDSGCRRREPAAWGRSGARTARGCRSPPEVGLAPFGRRRAGSGGACRRLQEHARGIVTYARRGTWTRPDPSRQPPAGRGGVGRDPVRAARRRIPARTPAREGGLEGQEEHRRVEKRRLVTAAAQPARCRRRLCRFSSSSCSRLQAGKEGPAPPRSPVASIAAIRAPPFPHRETSERELPLRPSTDLEGFARSSSAGSV